MKSFTQDSLIVASRQELVDIINSQASQNDALANKITELTIQLEWLKRQIFGAKSERFVEPDDLQTALELGIVDTSGNPPAETTTVTYERKKHAGKEPVKGHGRGSMPTHLPIKQTTIEPQQDTNGMVKIGEERTWFYEMDKPASLHIVEIIRPKYALPTKDGVVIGDLPALPVEKGNAGPGFIAHIVAEKYLYHMPLDRQRRKFKLEYNVDFSPSWLSDNVGKAVFWFNSMYDKYQEILLHATYLQADETPLQVLVRDERGKTHKGYLWVYHDPIRRIVLFDYRPSRSHQGPSEFLKNFKGTLQVDGYEGYADIITKNSLTHAACMDHVRRRFEKALSFDKVRAAHALDTMKQWYMVEREARERNLTFDERLALRKEKVTASMAAFKTWMQQQLAEVLPKSPIGVALQYALNQWEFFTPYLTDGRIELSNILIENAIRPVTLGRKNFLFAGSHNAARWPAVIYSLAVIAKNHGINPFEYFKELLTELPRTMANDLGKFLIPAWKPKTAGDSLK
jgi:transposase